MTLTTLPCKLLMVMALQPANTPADGKLPTVPEMDSLQRQGSSFYIKKTQLVLTMAFLHPAKTAAMCTACHTMPIDLPLSHPFACAKPILKTDCAN